MGSQDRGDSADLVSRAQNGETDAFEQLVHEYGGYVHHLLLRTLRNPDDADDVAQEVWFSVSRALHRVEDPVRFRSWLSRTTLNAAFDFLRKSRRRPRLVSFVTEGDRNAHLDPHAMDPGEQILALDTRSRMWSALAALPERYRQAVVLREYAGYSYQAIGTGLGISRSAAETLTSRARRRLAAAYERAEQIDPGCTRILECLVELSEGGLSRREHDALREHARSCAACTGWLQLVGRASARTRLPALLFVPWQAARHLIDRSRQAWSGAGERAAAQMAGEGLRLTPPAPAESLSLVQMVVVGGLAAVSLIATGHAARMSDRDAPVPPVAIASATVREARAMEPVSTSSQDSHAPDEIARPPDTRTAPTALAAPTDSQAPRVDGQQYETATRSMEREETGRPDLGSLVAFQASAAIQSIATEPAAETPPDVRVSDVPDGDRSAARRSSVAPGTPRGRMPGVPSATARQELRADEGERQHHPNPARASGEPGAGTGSPGKSPDPPPARGPNMPDGP